MQKALVGCLLLAILGAPLFAAENTYSLGGGIAVSSVEVDEGAELDGTGAFGTFRINARNGSFLFFSLSATDGDETATVDIGTTTQNVKIEDSFLRLGIGAGYMFRRDSLFRLFLHGGFAYLEAQEEIDGVDSVDDTSFALSFGGGIEVGKGHHALYVNVGFDYNHDVEYFTNLAVGNVAGRSDFNLLEAQVGYIYNF
jgi:hypothetical protein